MVNAESSSSQTDSKRGGGFLGFFTSRQPKKVVVKADLGENNKFVYDQQNKIWVEKGKEKSQNTAVQFLAPTPPPNRNDITSHQISPELSFTELPDKSGVSFNRNQISQKYVQSQFEVSSSEVKPNNLSPVPSFHRAPSSNVFVPQNTVDNLSPTSNYQSVYSLYQSQEGGESKRSKRTKISSQQSHTMHEYSGEQSTGLDLYASITNEEAQHTKGIIAHENRTETKNTRNSFDSRKELTQQVDDNSQNLGSKNQLQCSDDSHISQDQRLGDEFKSSPFNLDQNQVERSNLNTIKSSNNNGTILDELLSSQQSFQPKNGFSHLNDQHNFKNSNNLQNGKIFHGIAPQQSPEKNQTLEEDDYLLASDVNYLDDRNHVYHDNEEEDDYDEDLGSQYLDSQMHGYVDLQNQQDMHDMHNMQSSDAYTHYMEWMNNRWQSYVINLSIEEQNKLQKDNQYYESHFNDWVGQVYIQYYQLYPDYYDQLFIQPSKHMHAFGQGDDDEEEQKSPLEQQQKINQLDFDLNYDRTASDSSSSTIEHYPSLDTWMLKDSLILEKSVRNRKEGKLHGPTPWENQEKWVIKEEAEFEGDQNNKIINFNQKIEGDLNNQINSNLTDLYQKIEGDENKFDQNNDDVVNSNCVNFNLQNNALIDVNQNIGNSLSKEESQNLKSSLHEKKQIVDKLNLNQIENNLNLNQDLSPVSRDLPNSLFEDESLNQNIRNQDNIDNQLFQTNIENPLFDLRTSSFTSQIGNLNQNQMHSQNFDQSDSFQPSDENAPPQDLQSSPQQKSFKLSLNQLDQLSQNLSQQIQLTPRGQEGDQGAERMRPPTPNNQDFHSPMSMNVSMSSTPRDCFSPPSDDPPSQQVNDTQIQVLQQRLQQPCSSRQAEELQQQLQQSRVEIRSHQIQINDLLVALGQESAKVQRLREMLLEKGVDEEEIEGVLEIVEEEVGWGEMEEDEGDSEDEDDDDEDSENA